MSQIKKLESIFAIPIKAVINADFNAAETAKLPTIKELRQEYAQLIVQKKEAYKGYREAKREMQELLKARQNVEQFYGEDLKKEREQARNLKKYL